MKLEKDFNNYRIITVTSILAISIFLFTPIHGDDLVSPFLFYEDNSGSFLHFISSINLNYDGHFNFFGEFIGGLWLNAWGLVLEKTNSIFLFNTYYSLTKFLLIILFIKLISIFYNRRSANESKKKSIIMVLASFGLITVYHVNWSSDPVGNYPLIGYVATSLGALFILILTSAKTSKNGLSWLTLAFVFIIAVFYYEMNLALIFVFLLHHRQKIGKKVRIVLLVTSILLFLILVIVNHQLKVYSGGDFNLSWKVLVSLFVQLTSIFPFSTFPLAIYFNHFTIVTVTGMFIVALIAYRYYISHFPKDIKSSLITRAKSILQEEEIKLLGAYYFFSCLVFSLTSKYQNEILFPGQVYMSYTVGQLLGVLVLAKLLSCVFQGKNLPPLLITLLVVCNTAQNVLLINTLSSRTESSAALIKSWDKSEKERCLALSNWNRNPWDRDYLESMSKSFSATFETLKLEPFCGSNLDVREK